jgi:hypothetical protein
MRLRDMLNHIGDNMPDVIIGGAVKDMPPVPLCPQNAPGPQQPKVMADKRLREFQRLGNVTD